MPRRVRQGLLHQTKASCFDRRRQSADRIDVDTNSESGPSRLAISQPAERRWQTQLVEDGGPQLEGQPAHLIEGPVDQRKRFREGTFPGRALTPLHRLQIELHGGQQLTEFVVELARDLAPFSLLRLEQAPRQSEKLLPLAAQFLVHAAGASGRLTR